MINEVFGYLIRDAFSCFPAFQLQKQAGVSGEQELGPDGKPITTRNFSMDTALEDKICDLYDLFVDVQKFEPKVFIL